MRLGGLEPFTVSDFPGLPAAMVFSQGCNFRCPFCHNHSLLTVQPAGELLAVEAFFTFLARRRGLLSGVVVSGGEPTLQSELPDFCRRIRDMGFAVKLDTNGSRPQVIAELIDQKLVDYIAMDIKAPLHRYAQLAGRPGAAQHITESIALIADSPVAHHFRTTWVKPLLSEEDIRAIKKLVPAGASHRLQDFVAAHALDPVLHNTC